MEQGLLKNEKLVAVKKLTIGQSSKAKADFESEVKLISNVHHRNLIRLLGCCSKGPELLLVYEYMAKSSLDKFLFGDKRGTLNWKQRLDIIIGTARGLAYLHEEFHAWKLYEDDMLMELVDESLDPNEYKSEDVKKVIEIALLCTQSSVASRPTMSEAVVMLLSKGSQEYRPTRPTFIDATNKAKGDTSTSTASSKSYATVSVTEVSGR
ncbi:hypothetical protein HHK36_014617 [Tetracentron sinense]|uniref:Protein kinase domain-containing protein n=1 Tax=Tetracentron sinense TaxID=13715 RepID=A0A834Z0H2_TETSI|nr:hypothetical protein HHK36_014617 [Tetracentron sinense]